MDRARSFARALAALAVVLLSVLIPLSLSLYVENCKIKHELSKLRDEVRRLEIENRILRDRLKCRGMAFDYLEGRLLNLSVKLAIAEDERERLKMEVSELRETVRDLRKIIKAYEEVPKNYYSYDKDLLRIFLKHVVIPHGYKKDVFDCSEISSFMEWLLENYGFHAKIAVGERDGVGHAWVIVCFNGSSCYVDFRCNGSSCYPVIAGDEKRYKVRMVFESVYDAIRAYGGTGEWDWWRVLGFPKVRSKDCSSKVTSSTS